jgi:hypothetical protein
MKSSSKNPFVLAQLNRRNIVRYLVQLTIGATACLLALNQTHAAFHLWGVDEIYSSADGSVQFIELSCGSSFQNAMATHAITVSGPLGTHSFTFPANLSSTATANKNFIIGTSNLASIPGGVTPDYVLTNSVPFLFVHGGGTVTVGITGSIITPVTYTDLPTDGDSSLVLSGGVMVPAVTNSPRNFNNQSNSIVAVKFTSASANAGDFIMNFRTATGVDQGAGPTYAVDYKNSLADLNWTPLATNAGDGTPKSVTNALSSAPSRLYRLRVH